MMFKGLIAGILPALLLSGLALGESSQGTSGSTKHRSKCRSNRGGHSKNSTSDVGYGNKGPVTNNRAVWMENFSIDTDYERTMPPGQIRKVSAH